MEAYKIIADLTKPATGGGSGGTSDYTDLTNKPKINSTTLSGNKSAADLSLVGDVQVNGTSVVSSGVANIPVSSSSNLGCVKTSTSYGLQITSSGNIATAAANQSEILAKTNTYKPIVPSSLDYAVRSVAPACTTITASSTTATITANTTYAHAVSASGCTYTLTTPSATDVYSGFILMIDTTNSASIAFQTDGSPATSIALNGSPTIATGKKYTVTGQYSPLSSAWELFIIEFKS